jgi:hypothetical protein
VCPRLHTRSTDTPRSSFLLQATSSLPSDHACLASMRSSSASAALMARSLLTDTPALRQSCSLLMAYLALTPSNSKYCIAALASDNCKQDRALLMHIHIDPALLAVQRARTLEELAIALRACTA